jgi:hypothetical protein
VTTGIGKSREENQTAPGRAAPAHVALEDKGAVVHTHTLAVKRGIGQTQTVIAPVGPPTGEGLLRLGIACRGNEGDVAGQGPRRL